MKKIFKGFNNYTTKYFVIKKKIQTNNTNL